MGNPIKDWTSFMDFGLGFNSSDGKIRGASVTMPQPPHSVGGDGQTIFFSCHKTESVEAVYAQLGLSVDASGSAGLFGGSDKFQFLQSTNLHSYSVFMVVSIQVSNASQHILGEELLPQVATLLSNGENDRFLASFGDLYIKGIESGGEYFAIIEVLTTDATNQTTISNALDSAVFFGDGGAELMSKFTSNFVHTTRNHTLNINVHQRGGLGEGTKQGVTAGELLDKALNFATEIQNHPTPYRAELQDYVSLNPPKPPNLIDIQNAKDVLRQLATNRSILLQFINDVTFILSNPQQFDKPDVDLNALANQAREMYNKITQAASACTDDVHACKLIDITLPDRRVLPKRNAPPPVQVPNLIGMTQGDAETLIRLQGLKSTVTTSPVFFPLPSPDVGKVVAQDPAPLTMIDAATPVDIAIGSLDWILKN